MDNSKTKKDREKQLRDRVLKARQHIAATSMWHNNQTGDKIPYAGGLRL